jgi:hypothetical protein
LHRNLSQKWRFFASKNNPSAVPWIFEKAAIPFARGGLFSGCKSRVVDLRLKLTRDLHLKMTRPSGRIMA